jgi:hypothetical protein
MGDLAMQDGIRIHGRIEVIERDARTRRVLSHYCGKNMVTTVGLDLIAERLRGNTAVSGLSDYALGSDGTPATVGYVSLLAETYRGAITESRVSAGELFITLHLGATQGNGLSFQEGGALNADGTLLCRAVFPLQSKTSSKELTIVHTITFEAL